MSRFDKTTVNAVCDALEPVLGKGVPFCVFWWDVPEQEGGQKYHWCGNVQPTEETFSALEYAIGDVKINYKLEGVRNEPHN